MFGFGKKDKAATKEKPAEKPAKEKHAKAKAEPKPEKKHEHQDHEDHGHEHGDLKVKLKEHKGCTAVLAVEVPADRVEEQVQDSFRRVQAKAKIPGFRPGKAPLEMVKKNFEGAAREDALDQMLRIAVHEALHEQKLEPVAVPTVNDIQYALGKPLKFEVKVECSPVVELKSYKGLAVEKKSTDVPEEEVAKRLEEMRETNAKLVPSAAEAVGEKHFAVVDYIGTLDGLPIEGGKAEGQVIDMSAPQALAGFTEGIKGAKTGERRSVPVMFPAEHPKKELAGKQVVFQVTVTEIKEKSVPALDDEFAKDVGTNDMADLRERLRKSMEHERKRAERQRLEKEVSDRLLDNHDFEVPPSMVAERAQYLTANLKQYLAKQGASEEDWKANEAKMLERNKSEAERSIRLSYLLTKIADEEKLEVTDAEVDDVLAKSVESVEPARRKEMEKWMSGRRDEVRAQLKEEKIFNLLIDNTVHQSSR